MANFSTIFLPLKAKLCKYASIDQWGRKAIMSCDMMQGSPAKGVGQLSLPPTLARWSEHHVLNTEHASLSDEWISDSPLNCVLFRASWLASEEQIFEQIKCSFSTLNHIVTKHDLLLHAYTPLNKTSLLGALRHIGVGSWIIMSLNMGHYEFNIECTHHA